MAEHLGKGGEARGTLAGLAPAAVLPPPVGGKGLSCSTREMQQTEFIFWEKEGTGSDSSFLEGVIGKTLGVLQSCPNWASFINLRGVIAVSWLRKMKGILLQTESCPSKNTAMWFDTIRYIYNQKYQRKIIGGHGQVIWVCDAE